MLEGPTVAYEEYGVLEGPVILLCHGGLSSAHAAGKYAEDDALPGWWDDVVGPGRALDTSRFRILSMNALGSMYGSCGPKSMDLSTGKRYGPTFPALSLRDQVRFMASFLDALKIERLYCVAGPSMGALHALNFAAMYPERVERAIAVASAARMTGSGMAMHHYMMNAIEADPAFQDGWYDETRQLAAFKLIFQVIKLYYMSHKIFKKHGFDNVVQGPGAQAVRSANTRTFLTAGMDAGIRNYDANCLMRLLPAINSHDLGEGFATLEEGIRRIQCPVLLMNVDTDHEFPPECADELAEVLNQKRPGQASVRTIESDWGHMGCVRESGQLETYISEWLTASRSDEKRQH
ncbi:homoserine O-acetyltransferase [soil metagenome]